MSKDGSLKTIITQPKAVCDGAKTLGEFLIQRQRKAWQASGLSQPLGLTDDEQQTPFIQANARELGEKRGLSKVTQRKHIRELTKVGFIKKKKFRGSRASFYLWINPDFVWETPENIVETGRLANDACQGIGDFLGEKSKKLSHTEILEPLESLKLKIGHVDKLVSGPITGIPFSGNGGPQSVLIPSESKMKTSHLGRRANREEEMLLRSKNALLKARLDKEEGLVIACWEYAKSLIYKGQRFSPVEEKKAREAIKVGVYGNFTDIAEEQWSDFHKKVMRRVELAALYLQMNVGKYAPKPYFEQVPGCGYFDKENKDGFRGTEKWLIADEKRHAEFQLRQALRVAGKEMKQWVELNRGRRIKASKRVQNSTLWQLFAYHHRVLEALGGKQALYYFSKKLAILKIVLTPPICQNS
ncbi:hypothetical protein ACW9KT_08695 [Hymenobacter sp. HD11105]